MKVKLDIIIRDTMRIIRNMTKKLIPLAWKQYILFIERANIDTPSLA